MRQDRRTRRQAARQRREEILRDLRENGWRFLRDKGEKVARVVAQVPKKAMASGKKVAQRVLAVQKAAGLNRKLVEKSALSVVNDREPRHQSLGHTAWVQGYAAEVRQRLPGVLPEPPKAKEWFEVAPRYDPRGPQKDDVEPELH